MITDEPTVNRKSSRDGEGKIVRLFFAYLIFFFLSFCSSCVCFTCGKRTIISIMHSRKTANSTNRISDPLAIGILTLFLGQQHSSAALCF